MADLLSVPGGTGKQASLELVKRLGTEGPLAAPRKGHWYVRWLNQESARALAHAECQGDRVERIQVDLVRDARGIRVEQAEYITCTRTWYPNGWGFWDCFSQVIGRTRIHLK